MLCVNRIRFLRRARYSPARTSVNDTTSDSDVLTVWVPSGNEAGILQVIEVAVMPEAVCALAAVAAWSTSHMHTRLVIGAEPLNENKPFTDTVVTASPFNMLGGFNDSMFGQVPPEFVQLASEY